MRSIDESFYKTAEWKTCRKQYLDRVDHLCERCREKGLYVPARFVHHKIHLNSKNVHDPNISLSFNNLLAVCHECHNEIHFRKNERRWKYVDGKIVTEGD